MPAVNVLIKPASSACNMACAYCFYRDVAEHRELARQYGILQAPTLVIRRDGQVEKLVGAAAVTAYAQNHN